QTPSLVRMRGCFVLAVRKGSWTPQPMSGVAPIPAGICRSTPDGWHLTFYSTRSPGGVFLSGLVVFARARLMVRRSGWNGARDRVAKAHTKRKAISTRRRGQMFERVPTNPFPRTVEDAVVHDRLVQHPGQEVPRQGHENVAGACVPCGEDEDQ